MAGPVVTGVMRAINTLEMPEVWRFNIRGPIRHYYERHVDDPAHEAAYREWHRVRMWMRRRPCPAQ